MTTSAFWSTAGFGGGGGSGATLFAAVAGFAGEAFVAALAVEPEAPLLDDELFLHVGKLNASRHGISAKRISIKTDTPYR